MVKSVKVVKVVKVICINYRQKMEIKPFVISINITKGFFYVFFNN